MFKKSVIGKGLLVLAGFENNDPREDIEWIVKNCEVADF